MIHSELPQQITERYLTQFADSRSYHRNFVTTNFVTTKIGDIPERFETQAPPLNPAK